MQVSSEVVVCPGGKAACNVGNTCCLINPTTKQYGCCPLPNVSSCMWVLELMNKSITEYSHYRNKPMQYTVFFSSMKNYIFFIEKEKNEKRYILLIQCLIVF